MSLPIPARNRAIVKKTTGSAVVSDIPVPKLRDSYMLVKTAAMALNPADWTDIDYDGGYEGCAVGLDYAGTVILPSPTSTEKTFQERGQGLRTCAWLQFRPAGRRGVCRLHPRQGWSADARA
jgi:NADPH:quinone reductase-like Zn-dependent oxidoreductase